MKSLKSLVWLALFCGLAATPLVCSADDTKPAKPKPRPYVLTNCIVSGEKLGGDMGKPYVFIYKDKKLKDDPGREIKLCCKSCLKDFDKDTVAFLKKIDEAEAKEKAKAKDKEKN